MTDPAQEAYYDYLDFLVREMTELFEQHEELVAEYDRGMRHLQEKGWRAGYVQRHADGVASKEKDDGDSSD